MSTELQNWLTLTENVDFKTKSATQIKLIETYDSAISRANIDQITFLCRIFSDRFHHILDLGRRCRNVGKTDFPESRNDERETN